jgi:hypothetical protein
MGLPRIRKLALALLLVVSPCAARVAWAGEPPAPSEDAMTEARNRYARGIQLAKEGAFDQAQVELERAYQLWPSYKILYNLALTKRELGDNVGSLRAFEKYLSEGGAEIPAARRTEVEERIAKLKARVGALDVKVSVDGSEILVDDISMGRSPLGAPLLVNAGRRKVTALAPSAAPISKIVDVGGGDTIAVQFEIPPAAPPGTSVPPRNGETPGQQRGDTGPTTPAPQRSSTPLLVAWSATGVLAAGAVVTGLLSLSASNELKDAKARPDPAADDLSSSASRAQTLALVTDVLTAAAVIAGGISVYLTISRSSSDRAHAATVRRTTGDTRLELRGAGVWMQTSF